MGYCNYDCDNVDFSVGRRVMVPHASGINAQFASSGKFK